MPLDTLAIKRELTSYLDALTIRVEPFEACALLLGRMTEEKYIVNKIIPMENEDSSEIKFRISETKLDEVFRYANILNLQIMGIFHSHPSHPLPSKTDVKYMEINPVPWIIKSSTTGEMKCFIHDENFEIKEIKIIVMD